MSTVELLAYALFALAVLLRLLCGRIVKGGASKHADDAQFRAPIARRWVGPAAVRFGAWGSLAALLLATALLAYVHLG